MAGAFEKSGDLSGALRFYLQARASYQAICISDPKDAEDCLELAGVQDRIARIYIRQGKLEEALAEYQKAVALSELRSGGAEPNLEALYSAMNAHYGMGEVSVARARRSGSREKKLQSWKEARSWYQKSQADFLRIPGWHPITPNEFEAVNPKQIEARLSLCQSALGSGTASRQNSANASSPFGRNR
jgi:tetratricopeptide (TPR) repeat protein